MKLAILKIADTCQLTVLKCNENLTKNSIVVVYSLEPESPLTECQALLSSMQVDELWVVLQSNVVSKQQTEHIICRTIGKGTAEKMSVFNTKDIAKIKYVAENLGVFGLRIFDMLDIFCCMSLENNLILCSEYYDGRYAFMYASDGDIKDYRVWRLPEVTQVKNLMGEYGVKQSLSIYNNLLDNVYKEVITNWQALSIEERQLLGISVGAFTIEPIKIYQLQDDSLFEISSRSLASADAPLELIVQEHEVYPEESKKSMVIKGISLPSIKLPKFVSMDEDLGKNKSPINLTCNIVGVGLSIILAFSILGNKQLPKDIEYLTDKNTELSALVQPRQDTIDYFTKFSDAMTNKQPNIDETTFNSIKAVEVDGLLLGGIQIQKDNVGLVIYLKDEAQIDAYSKQLSSTITVSQVVKKGTVSLNSTALTKFVVNGKR